MILSITANPSVDISYSLDKLNIDQVTRAKDVKKDAGGKGIHVSYVLNILGEKVVNSGFVGGKLGEYIEESLENKGMESRFIQVDGESRNCIAIIHEGKQTEILEQGPTISKAEEEAFIKSLGEICNNCDIVNISGSLPRGLDAGFYEKIIEYCRKKNIFISLDTSGKTLEDILRSKYKPNLIKPNETEICDLLGKSLPKEEEKIREVLRGDIFEGIDYLVISKGKSGAIFKIKDKFYMAKVPVIKAVNPVGSGDSTVAGCLSAIEKGEDDISLIKKAMTCGLLNAIDPEIGHIDMEKFEEYYKKIEVREF